MIYLHQINSSKNKYLDKHINTEIDVFHVFHTKVIQYNSYLIQLNHALSHDQLHYNQ